MASASRAYTGEKAGVASKDVSLERAQMGPTTMVVGQPTSRHQNQTNTTLFGACLDERVERAVAFELGLALDFLEERRHVKGYTRLHVLRNCVLRGAQLLHHLPQRPHVVRRHRVDIRLKVLPKLGAPLFSGRHLVLQPFPH